MIARRLIKLWILLGSLTDGQDFCIRECKDSVISMLPSRGEGIEVKHVRCVSRHYNKQRWETKSSESNGRCMLHEPDLL